MDDLIKKFDVAMFNIYKDAKEKAGYNATIFLQMLTDHGGLDTALRLIRAPKPSDGYTALWERGHLDLTVEALVIRPPWNSLFSTDDIEKSKKRLKEYGFVSKETS